MRYHACMTNAMTVRLDEETARKLAELAESQPSRSAAVTEAIRQAWRQLQENKLEAAYAAVAAADPAYPYESEDERSTARARRNAREARA